MVAAACLLCHRERIGRSKHSENGLRNGMQSNLNKHFEISRFILPIFIFKVFYLKLNV